MLDMIKAMLAGATNNPVGLFLAMCALAFYGGGQKLSESAVEPFGTIMQGFAGVLVLIAGAWMKRKPPTPPGTPPVAIEATPATGVAVAA